MVGASGEDVGPLLGFGAEFPVKLTGTVVVVACELLIVVGTLPILFETGLVTDDEEVLAINGVMLPPVTGGVPGDVCVPPVLAGLALV
jgi:hypothetical protein